MMEWYQNISYLLTNELRLIIGLFLVTRLMDFSPDRKLLILSAFGGCFVTILQAASLPTMAFMAAEILIVLAITWYSMRERLRLCLFLTFSYEVGVGLWDFLLSAGLGVLFHSERFINPYAPEYLIGIWLVRLLMAGSVILVVKWRGDTPIKAFWPVSMTALLGLLGVITLSEQTILPLDDDLIWSWIIFSMILLFSILFYRMNRQREMELEIARLKTEQTELLERDYQNLNHAYSTHAKLYHDLHNHLDAIYSYIIQGETKNALDYIEDLRTPIEKIVRYVWTGDEAVDYLISSKLSAADHSGIETKVNIEFPRRTNIRSADLTAILGNLLDNALEAAANSNEGSRFLYLTIRRINDMLIIKVENNCTLEPAICGTEIRTTKEDNTLHGWGLKSARATAERYDGTLELTCENGVFCAVATLCFEAI